MPKPTLSIAKQYLLGFALLIVVLAFAWLYVIEAAEQPYVRAKETVVGIASSYADVTSVTDFQIYNGTATYYSLLGKTSQGQEVAILVPDDQAGDILVYGLDDGISQAEAEATAHINGAEEVSKVTFGYEDNQAIWEVATKAQYYLISFETGQFIRRIG